MDHEVGHAEARDIGALRWSRRRVLHASAVSAGAITLAACAGKSNDGSGSADGTPGNKGSGPAKAKGSSTTPPKPPARFYESPELTKLVDAGKLPKLADRIPEHPYVVPHLWLKRGKYGGLMSTVAGASDDSAIKEYFYGSSLLRWLNDGMSVGPGLVEHWDHNADTSEWTLKLRQGLKWSDGQPFTADDIMFWWTDLVLNPEHGEVPPDGMKSGKGTVATMKKVDDLTLQISYDAPSPLCAEQIAIRTNGSIGNGPRWIVPAHFAKQFHPKYNKKIGKDWASGDGAFEKNVDFSKNPKCPTMNAWMLDSVKEGREVRYVRNPFYYEVTRDGDQLPYLDTFLVRVFKENKSGKLQVFQGNVDFLMGQFYNTDLPDIAQLQDSADKAGTEYYLWDSGSGTSAMFFFNYDHKDPKLRALIRNPQFRRAVSHCYNREVVRKAVYYQQGQVTTGTISPKAKEYRAPEGKKLYEQWRDLALAYDPAKANKMLDDLGLKKGAGGKRTFPNGSRLRITLDTPSDTSNEYNEANAYLAKDMQAVGLDAIVNPLPPDNYGNQWNTGQLTMHTAWEVGDGPTHLINPQWLLPISNERWAPLEGQWYALIGTPDAEKGLNADPFKSQPPRMKPEKGGSVARMWELYDQAKLEPDELKRTKLVYEIVKIHIQDGPFFMGSVSNPPRVVVKKKDLANVPTKENLFLGGFTNTWSHPTPAVYDPETFFWTDPSQHPNA